MFSFSLRGCSSRAFSALISRGGDKYMRPKKTMFIIAKTETMNTASESTIFSSRADHASISAICAGVG